jgi:hypothetical protein
MYWRFDLKIREQFESSLECLIEETAALNVDRVDSSLECLIEETAVLNV